MENNKQENIETAYLDANKEIETDVECFYNRKKRGTLILSKEQLHLKYLKKSNLRMIIFLFHYYGLHKNITIKVDKIKPTRETLSVDFRSEINKKNEIEMFHSFELTDITEINMVNSISNLFLFILDKICPAYNKEEDKCIVNWCERVYWSIDGRDICFDISNRYTINGYMSWIVSESGKKYDNHSVNKNLFAWVINERSKHFFIIMFKWYANKENLHEKKDEYLYRSIDLIINNIRNKISEKNTLLYLMVVLDLLPIENKKKEEWLINLKKKWLEAASILPICSWFKKNDRIIEWIYRYITDTVFEKNVPSWMIYFFDWNDFENKSTQKKKNIILNVLYTLNDLSTTTKYKYSFQRLKKSAQKYTERNIIQEVNLSKSDIRNLENISMLTNEKPEKIISRLIERELLKLKNQN